MTRSFPLRTIVLGLIATTALTAGVQLPVVATAGSTFTVDFNGYGGDPVTAIDGLTSSVTFSNFTFTNASSNRTRITFEADINNTSSGPITASRVSVLGFNTTPTIASSGPHTVTGVFDTVRRNGTMPVGIGNVEFCLTDVNCAGGGSGGVTLGDSDTAYATIYVSGLNVTQLTFDDIYVRYQSIAGAGSITSAVGSPVVPEPGAYVVLSAGLGLLVWRRQRSAAKQAA